MQTSTILAYKESLHSNDFYQMCPTSNLLLIYNLSNRANRAVGSKLPEVPMGHNRQPNHGPIQVFKRINDM